MILLFKVAKKSSAEVLSSVPECKKSALCLMEKRRVLGKCHSGMSYSADSCEFNVNEAIM